MHCLTILTNLTFAQEFSNASRRVCDPKKKKGSVYAEVPEEQIILAKLFIASRQD